MKSNVPTNYLGWRRFHLLGTSNNENEFRLRLICNTNIKEYRVIRHTPIEKGHESSSKWWLTKCQINKNDEWFDCPSLKVTVSERLIESNQSQNFASIAWVVGRSYTKWGILFKNHHDYSAFKKLMDWS